MDLSEFFAEDGHLARSLDGFSMRAQQLAMAERIWLSLDSGGMLIVEAGTGTGKTLAYLIPALCSGKKVLVSTASKTLQDQLFGPELAKLRRMLGQPVRAVRLKGRRNYLCRYRLGLSLQSADDCPPALLQDLHQVARWAASTHSGDIGELSGLAGDSGIWPLITASAENCLGASCPDMETCFLMQARESAWEADLVVANHHLVFADLAMQQHSGREILPPFDAIIFDEAHHLPEVASAFMGRDFGSRHVVELVQDVQRMARQEAPALTQSGQVLLLALRDWLAGFAPGERKSDWLDIMLEPELAASTDRLGHALRSFLAQLAMGAERGRGLENCHGRAERLQSLLRFFERADDPAYLYWYETSRRDALLHAMPVRVDDSLAALQKPAGPALIFTSATLSVNGEFGHFQERLGLHAADTAHWESPFDYASQALLYLPRNLPDPREPEFLAAMLEAALPVLRAGRGRAFMLFTSHQALQQAAGWLAERIDYPLFVQGQAGQAVLLEQFRRSGNGVLLGAASFWEGVDVRGAGLSCVIIDKLPFASPQAPLSRAYANHLRATGRDPFRDGYLPQAVIALKQGVGRLIRAVDDRGVAMLCDPRLLTKPYGRIFLDSLPPMRRTRAIKDVQAFFDAGDRQEDHSDVGQ